MTRLDVRIVRKIASVLACAVFALLFAENVAAAPIDGDAAFRIRANSAIDRITQTDGFSGTILVARGDEVLVRRACGFAERSRRIPIEDDSKLPIESLTKQMTAAAILLLAEQRSLSLSDSAGKYVPQIPRPWKPITIQELLTHSSGIEDGECAKRGCRSYEDFIWDAEREPLAFKPGEGFLYSNAGYALLTAVIERVSHQTYAQFVASRIFGPLGMHDTGYGAIPHEYLRGYGLSQDNRSGQPEWRQGGAPDLAAHGGFGGVHSTAGDMLTWVRALSDGKLLSAESQSAMFRDYGHGYGMGWRISRKFGREMVWHTGSDPGAGFASILDTFPAEQLTVIALTNNTGLTKATASLEIDGHKTTIRATAAREVVEEIERLYFEGLS